MGAPDQKVILRFFSRHEVIYLCVKFQVGLTCPTGFLPANTTFFTNIWREYFSPNILRVFDQPEVEFSKSGQNWANTRPLLLKTFESSNCVDRHTVHCSWFFLEKLHSIVFSLLFRAGSDQTHSHSLISIESHFCRRKQISIDYLQVAEPHSAQCVKPLRIWEIKKWVPWPPFSAIEIISDRNIWVNIFWQFHFLSNIWVRVETPSQQYKNQFEFWQPCWRMW